jgi:hypothetical protein
LIRFVKPACLLVAKMPAGGELSEPAKVPGCILVARFVTEYRAIRYKAFPSVPKEIRASRPNLIA